MNNDSWQILFICLLVFGCIFNFSQCEMQKNNLSYKTKTSVIAATHSGVSGNCNECHGR